MAARPVARVRARALMREFSSKLTPSSTGEATLKSLMRATQPASKPSHAGAKIASSSLTLCALEVAKTRRALTGAPQRAP